MPDEMDVQRLMTEVKKRPTLWDVRFAEYKDRTNTPQLWQEIAEILGTDVEHCKRKWKNLRDAYRAEVRRTERRLERMKATGQFDPKINIASKWVYFEPMSFINESKRARHSMCSGIVAGGTGGDPADPESSAYEHRFHSFCDIKMEPHHTTDEDDDDENDLLFEEFKSVATPQAVRRLSDSIATAAEEGTAAADPAAGPNCKCTKRADDQVHFLENLEREEQKLMQSTRQDMTRSNSLSHVGDSDYNFLVSFLPQMKKMCELQNLQFRAKMSELVLNIMMPPGMQPPSVTFQQLPMQVTQAPTSSNSQNLMTISTTTPMQDVGGGLTACLTAQPQQLRREQAQQQQQVQLLQSELMEAEQADNDAAVNSVATSSSNWT